MYRPDLLLVTPDKSLYIVELTVGYETNLHKNVVRKREKYQDLVKEQSKHFYSVKFINFSISSLGVFDNSRAVKRNNCSFCDKSTMFTRSLPFNMTIYITYGGISEINPHCRKFKMSQVSL